MVRKPVPFSKLFVGAILALTLVGCGTPLVWFRPGTTVAEQRYDLQQCSQMAFREAQNNMWWRRSMYFDYYRPGPYYFYQSQRFDTDAMLEESRLQDFCMRARGYRLVPAEPVTTPQPMPPTPPSGAPPPPPPIRR